MPHVHSLCTIIWNAILEVPESACTDRQGAGYRQSGPQVRDMQIDRKVVYVRVLPHSYVAKRLCELKGTPLDQCFYNQTTMALIFVSD